MPNKEIKLKLTLNSIVEYDGGAEAFLNDIKNAGVIIHRDDEGFLMTSDCVGKYSAYTESVSNLNELDHLVVYDVNDNEIGKLKIDFLELDDSLYNIPEGSTFEETELIIGFLEPETYTILFTNLTHPEFDIALPEPMTVVEGESAALPSVEGEYEDTEYIYTPESWNIGAFESEITPTEDMTANLVWHSEAKIIEHTITFTNTTHPEFEVEFPESITVEDGESVSLPSVSGSFEDSGYEYTPLEWSIGAFGESFTPTEDVTANLLWKAEEIKPALPEVSSRNDFGDYNWLYVNTNLSYKTIQPNANEQLVFSISKSPAPYDSSKSYGVMIMQQYENGASGDSTLFSIINYSDTIGVKNISSNAVDAYAFRIAICSSSQAIIVIVYSSNNTAYNAFKYTLDGVDYYYVLDNIQTDWVNDLSSIGYSLTKHMPRVFELLPKSPSVSFGGYNTVVEATDIDGNQIPYSDVEDSMTFNNTSVICICFNNYTYGFVNAGEQVTSFFTNSNGYVAWKSSRYYQNDYCKFASFVSYPNNVTIVDVYQKEAPYRCCKAYYCDGQYFVIDRIQKEWVSDLNSIGYQLNEIENIAYLFGKFYLDGASVSYSQSMSIHVDSNDGLLYTCVGAYNSSGTDYKDRVTLNRNDKWISIYMSLSGNSNLNLYSIKYSTQNRMPKVVSPYKAQFGSSAQTISIQPNAISSWLYITYSSSNINKNDYSGFINGVVNLTDSSNNVVARTGLSAVWDNTNGGQGTYSGYNLAIRNDTGSDVSCMYSRVKLCQNNLIDVTVVTVYDSNNVAYNSFKYTTNGTDYYYVLDDIQSDWVTDLSSIGYSLNVRLPEVWSNYTMYFNKSGSGNYNFVANEVKRMFTSSGYTSSYDDTKSYAIQSCNDAGTFELRVGIPVVKDDVYIALRNDTGIDLNLSYAIIRICTSNQANVITVYDSNNNAYNSFKYSINGIDYYYVLDDTQTQWTDNLSSIGYSLTITMPTVSVSGDFGTNNLLSCTSGSGSGAFVYIAPNTTTQPYIYGTSNRPVYNSNKAYATIYAVDDEDNRIDATIVGYVNNGSSNLLVKNLGSSTILYNSSKVAVCSTSSAEIITVYNSSNETFNAFKYTVGGVDYYYVLDSTQTDWVSDLSSIGFSLTKQLPTVSENLTGYFVNASTTSISQNETKQIYSSDGTTRIQYDSSLIYGLMNFYYSVESWGYYRIAQAISDSGNLSFKNLGNSVSSCDRVYYKTCESNEATIVTVYNSRGYARNSFKYNLDGIDYYYVLDGEQNSWTDDLSNIGYSEILGGVLPEVVLFGNESYDYWLYTNSSMSGSTPIASNGTHILYGSPNSFPGYTTYPKATVVYQSVSGTDAGHTDFDAEEVTYGSTNVKVFGCRNVSSTSITLARIKMAYCQNSSVAVITVYDTNNVPYNAFKHIMYDTVTGTDYYYVLDGVQTEWTDDIESIGYYLGSTITLYMTSGNKYIDDDFTNNTGISGVPPVYADQATTTLYYWDYSKRIERGWYNQETGKWVASEIQTQADMPATTGADVYIQMPYGESGIFFGKNTSGNSYYTMTVLSDEFRIYNDAITVWVDEDHQDHTVTGTQTYISDVDWDDNVIYKALYLLRVNSVTNPTGASGYTNRLKNVSFENSNGKVAVKLILNTISITIAKIVFYAKKVSE